MEQDVINIALTYKTGLLQPYPKSLSVSGRSPTDLCVSEQILVLLPKVDATATVRLNPMGFIIGKCHIEGICIAGIRIFRIKKWMELYLLIPVFTYAPP